MKLGWQGWLYGFIAAIIGGGASAISAGIAQSVTDPSHADVHHLLSLMGTTFIVAGLISGAAYLSKSPIPQVETVTTVQNIQPSGDGIKATTVTQTTSETPKEK